jgi:hypothetical protein
MNAITKDDRRGVQSAAALFAALCCYVPKAFHNTGDFLERRFAKFAVVPYLSSARRQQWSDVWETEPEP